jgi:hypothetical protein
MLPIVARNDDLLRSCVTCRGPCLDQDLAVSFATCKGYLPPAFFPTHFFRGDSFRVLTMALKGNRREAIFLGAEAGFADTPNFSWARGCSKF